MMYEMDERILHLIRNDVIVCAAYNVAQREHLSYQRFLEECVIALCSDRRKVRIDDMISKFNMTQLPASK